MSKQTAVEWIVERFKQYQKEGEKMSWQQVIDTALLAKEMERQQIMDAFDECGQWQDNYSDAEHYFNETFNQ